jgi:hypothetical protein
MRDERFGFLPRHSTSLQLAHLVERINFGEKGLTGAVFLDVNKAFDPKFPVLPSPHHLLISSGSDI